MIKKSKLKVTALVLILAIGAFAIFSGVYEHAYASAVFTLIMLSVIITNRKKLLDKWFGSTPV